MRRVKDKILPSAIFIAIVVICFASVHTFNIDRQLCYRKGSIWSKSATNAISTTKIFGLKSPVPLPLNAHRSIKTEMMTAVMDSAVVSSFLSFAKGSVKNLKGISINGIIGTFRAEVSREVAILFYAPLKRKAIFLLHPVAMILFIVSMSRLIPLMIEGVKKVGSTSVSMATDFSVSVSDARKKVAEKAAAARQSRVESLALAAAAAATASTLKKEKDALVAIEKAKKLAVAKAMKEEDERLATETVKAKAEERARLNLENNEKKMKAQRLAVEQAAIRQEEMVRLAKEKKLQQVRETEAKVAQVQARKEDQNRVLAEQKAAREESSRVIVAKKEEQMRLQAETKERKVRTELNLKAEKQALLNYQAKVAEDARQQVLAKQRATDQSRLAQIKETENRVKREKKERDELLAQQLVLKAMEDIERANAKAEVDRIHAAERALKVEGEKKALAAMYKRKEEDVRAAKEMKKRVENEALMAVQKERELQLMKTKNERLEKKWGPAVLVGITPEPLPWLQKTSSALSVRALITKAREVELAEDARAAENERSIAKAKADIEYARNKAIALAAEEALEAVRLEALRIEVVKKEALPQPLPLPVPLSDLTHVSSVAVSEAVTITVTIDAAVTSTMTHTITEGMTV